MSELHNIFRKVADRIEKVTDDIEELVSGGSGEKHSHTHAVEGCADQHAEHAHVRYHSFQSPSTGTPKWYVDGASYFWAVSESILRRCRAFEGRMN